MLWTILKKVRLYKLNLTIFMTDLALCYTLMIDYSDFLGFGFTYKEERINFVYTYSIYYPQYKRLIKIISSRWKSFPFERLAPDIRFVVISNSLLKDSILLSVLVLVIRQI